MRQLRTRNALAWLLALAGAAATVAAPDMPAFDPREATIDSVRDAVLGRRATVRSVTEAFLARVEALNPHVNAIIALNPNALDEADALDAALEEGGECGPLFGVPVFLKDNYDTVSVPTTAGCLALNDSRPSQDAPVVAALKRAGAIVLGKANLHELALEGLTVSSLGGQTVNPYDRTRTPGGSSGGSAVAVAASFCVFATGTDTVNSLRSPPSANSLFSIRPTWGLLGRTGIVPISYNQDVIGPIARRVKDVATALTVMAGVGYDPGDNATALVPQDRLGLDYAAELESGTLRGKRFGLVEGFFNRTASHETTPVNEVMAHMVQKLQDAGATVVPLADALFNSTAISNQLDTQRYEYRERLSAYLQQPSLGGKHPRSMPELYTGTKEFLVIPSQYEYVNTALVSSTSNATYDGVLRAIQELRIAVLKIFKQQDLDALIYPEQANLVVEIGSPSQKGRNGILAAVTGMPVCVVPAGFSPATGTAPLGVPIGMEILGRHWEEQKLLQIAYQMEKLEGVRRPPEFAAQAVEASRMASVPSLRPDSANIALAYPVGRI